MHVTLTRRRVLLVVLAGLAVAGLLAYPFLAPKASTAVQQPLPAGAGAPVKQGAFRDGAPGHHAEGMVKVLRGSEGWFLRFEGYDATAGPDVYFFLSRVAEPRTTQEVEGGVKLLVPGGDQDGEATLRGAFNVPLPAGFDPAAWSSVAVWCDNFDVLFGSAPLA